MFPSRTMTVKTQYLTGHKSNNQTSKDSWLDEDDPIRSMMDREIYHQKVCFGKKMIFKQARR